ncbi:MAG: protein kinase, partial [Planctomycetota bacterium]
MRSRIPLETRFRIEAAGTEFESKWREKPGDATIETFLGAHDAAIRPYLLAELVAVECELKSKQGHEPHKESYYRRFPDDRETIDDAFATWRAASTGSNDREAPKRIGDYRILQELGRGGMAVVYEAEQESLGRRVAIKAIKIDPLNRPEQRERFRREANSIANLHHGNIIDVYGSGEADGLCY